MLRQRVWKAGSFASLPLRVESMPSCKALIMVLLEMKVVSVSVSKVISRIDSVTVVTYGIVVVVVVWSSG